MNIFKCEFLHFSDNIGHLLVSRTSSNCVSFKCCFCSNFCIPAVACQRAVHLSNQLHVVEQQVEAMEVQEKLTL